MAQTILAETTASVSELKRNPMGTVAAGVGFAVAILNRNEAGFYCVPAKAFAALMERIEDMELNAIADARSGAKRVQCQSRCYANSRFWKSAEGVEEARLQHARAVSQEPLR